MKIINKVFLVLIVSILFTACEQDINIELPYEGKKIVVNTIMINGRVVNAHITRSEPVSLNVYNFQELENCKADLYENDIFKETLTLKTVGELKYYVSKYAVKGLNKYTLKISSEGLQSVEGNDVIPVKSAFQPIDYWRLSTGTNSSLPFKLSLRLKDEAGKKNFYRMRIYGSTYDATTKKYSVNKSLAFRFNVDNLASQSGDILGINIHDPYVIYFSDDTFDGQEITFNIGLESRAESNLYIAPEITTLSQSAYLYLDSKTKQDNNEDNPFSESVSVYSNVNNGYGIIGGMADSLAMIKRSN